MTALLLKSTIAMFSALLLVTLARRSRASLRHLILSALYGFLLLLPAVQAVAPALRIAVPERIGSKPWVAAAIEPAPVTQPAPTQLAAPAPVKQRSTINYLVLGYFSVATFLLVWLAVGVARLRSLAARAEIWLDGTTRMNEIANEAGIRRSALVVLSNDVSVPLTFGFRRSTIVMPFVAREWSADELTRALRHELEHVRREDWALQLAARIACAFYWPHPLVWPAWRRFCLEAERACDDAVIRSSEPTAYAGQLVSLARNLRRFTTVPALGMPSRSKLAQRVNAILDPRQPRGPHGELSAAIVMVMLVSLLICVAPARLIAAASELDSAVKEAIDLDAPALGEAMVQLGEAGDIENLRSLIAAGVDVNRVAPGDGTALIGAARAGQMRTVEFLLDERADPNLASRGDGNPLIAAAGHGHVDIVQRLLDAGADRDAIVPGDENPLMQAAANGHEDVVRLLIARGADVNARAYEDGELRTPLRLATRHNHPEIVQMLIAAGAKE